MAVTREFAEERKLILNRLVQRAQAGSWDSAHACAHALGAETMLDARPNGDSHYVYVLPLPPPSFLCLRHSRHTCLREWSRHVTLHEKLTEVLPSRSVLLHVSGSSGWVPHRLPAY